LGWFTNFVDQLLSKIQHHRVNIQRVMNRTMGLIESVKIMPTQLRCSNFISSCGSPNEMIPVGLVS
jgi:hypothetical protein